MDGESLSVTGGSRSVTADHTQQAKKVETEMTPTTEAQPQQTGVAEEKKRLRSIEKSRVSTCRFADLVAESVIKVYRNLDIPDKAANEALRGQSAQTCVSAIVMLENQDLTVCSLGIGTKIVSEEIARGDMEGRRVLDSHAEVLARRGFVRFLFAQARASRLCMENGIFISGGLPLKLREGITFHLYCSSAPCGNACVRRWAKGVTETFHEALGAFQWPNPPHPRFLVHSELQTAVLCKVRNLPTAATEADLTMPKADPLEIPPGTALPGSQQASSRATCSDKVARWCALGMEGALFHSLLSPESRAIRPATVVVGRKFSRLHLERAICCRLMSFWQKDALHPAALCTAIKLHEGGIAQEEKARFHDYALVWALEWDEQKPAEVIKPTEGLPIEATAMRSMVSRSAFLELYNRETITQDGMVGHIFNQEEYRNLKNQVSTAERRHKQDLLLSKYLKHWPRYRCREYEQQTAISSSDPNRA